MSKSLRAQVSLIFSDEDLFDNFVVPLRDNKELSGMITKLLYAYYNNEEVRNLIEGVSFNDVVDNAEQVFDSTEAINRMRQTLAMQGYLYEQAKQTLEDGTSEMDALLKANDIAKKSGVVRTESTDVGEALVNLSLEKTISESEIKEEVQPIENSDLAGRVGKIEEALSTIINMLQNGSFNQGTPPTSTVITEEKVQEEVKIPSLNVDTQVVPNQKEEEPIIESSVVSVEETTTVSNDEVEENVSMDDASDMLGDILKDLTV